MLLAFVLCFISGICIIAAIGAKSDHEDGAAIWLALVSLFLTSCVVYLKWG